MAILKRILRIIRFLVLLSIALVVGVIAVLTLTQKGRENLAGLISSMASSPGSSVRIVGLSGIWSGPLKIDNLVLEDSDGAWLAARGIAIDWSPLSLLSSTFEASLVHADRVELARLPKAGAKSSEGGGLPVSLEIDRIDLPEIALGGALAGEVAQVSAEGSLEANADPLTVKTDLKLLRSDGKAGALDAKIDFAPAEDRLAVDIHGSEPAGGIIANFLKLPGAPPVEIAMSGTGPAADWKVSGTFSVDGEVVTKISGTRQSTDKGNRIEAKGEGVFERFVPKTFRPLLAGQATFDFAGILTKQGGVIIGRANLESSALTATAKGVIDPSAASDFSMELAARGAPATLTFGEGDAAVTAAISKASLRAFGAGDAPTIDAAASLAKVTTATAELNGVEATLHSDGFDIANRSGPVTLSATAESAGSADPTIASLLAGALKADATATISGDGVHLDKAALSGDALSAAVQGDVSLTDGSLKLAVESDLLAALLPEAARAALAEKVNVVATVSRDAAGVVTVDPFTAKSGGLDASGTIALAADTLGVELTGNLADVSKLAPEIAGAIGFQISANGARTAPDVSATVSSDKLTAAGREITSLELSANGKADMANPAATVSIKGEVAGEALSGEAVLKTSDGMRRIDGLSLTLGANTITGDLGLDPAFVPEGALAFTLPDIAPLAALAFERAAGEVKGSLRFGSTDGVPQLSIDADIASIVRGDLSVKGASVTALVKNYLVAPAVSGQVHAPLVTSGSTSVSDVDVALTRDGDWTGFSGGATVNDIVAKAAGRAKIAPGATTIELASGTATTRGISAELAGASTLVIKGGETALDKLRLGVSGGTVEVTGTVGKALNLDIQIGALPASIVTAFAPALSATGTLSGSARISRAIDTATDSSAANDLSLELAADGAPATLALGEGDAAVTVAISKASLRAFGAGDAPTIDAAASLAKVTTATAEASGIEAKLHSDGFDIANRSGPVTLSATAESAGSADETIAGLLAGALKADITAAISRDGVHFDKATLSDDALSASVAGDVSLTDGSLTLAVEADLLAALLPEAARAALADKVSVVATVSRDAAGAIRVDPLTAKSGGLDATGSVALAADTIGVELKGGLADISKLAPDTEGAIGFQISASGARSAPDISATISSDKFTAAGREITGLQFSAKGKADMANPAATVSITGNVAGEALAGAAVLKTADGQRRIDGLSLTLGANTITGDLALDQAFVPEGALAFTLPDIGPLAALAFDKAAGEVKGTISFSKIGTVPQLTLDARSASIARGDLSVKSAEVTASVQNYLVTPAISGKVRALSVVSGSTSVSDVDVALTRDGDWTGFSGGATVNDIVARAAGRAKIAQGATTIELASGTATTRGVTAKLARATTVVIKGGETTLDRLALGVGGGSVQVTGTAGQALNLDIQISALPATVVNAFAPGLGAVGAISGTARISGAAAKPDIGYTLQWENAADDADALGRLRRDEHQLERHSGGRRARVHRQRRRRLRPWHEGRRHRRHGSTHAVARFFGRRAVLLPDQAARRPRAVAVGHVECQPGAARLDRARRWSAARSPPAVRAWSMPDPALP